MANLHKTVAAGTPAKQFWLKRHLELFKREQKLFKRYLDLLGELVQSAE